MKPSFSTRPALIAVAALFAAAAFALTSNPVCTGAPPEYRPNPKSQQLHQAYRRSEVEVRARYGQAVPWKYILHRPDRFDYETIRLAEVAQQMEGEHYRHETDFTTITNRRISSWREQARRNRQTRDPEDLSLAQAELAREITEHFLGKLDNDFRQYGRTGATIRDALLHVRTLSEPGFYMTPVGREFGPDVSILRAQAIIADAYFSHADIFSVDAGDTPAQLVKLGVELALSVRVNEFDGDHPASLRFRYLRNLTRRLDGSGSRTGEFVTDEELGARLAFLEALPSLERDSHARAQITFVANEDTVDYARIVTNRLNSLQMLKLLHALPHAGRPPATGEPGKSASEAQKLMAGYYLETATDPSLVGVHHVPTLIAFLSTNPDEQNRALLAWAEANRRYHRIPSSFVPAVRAAGSNADATKRALSLLTEDQHPAPERSLPRLRIYDRLMR